MAAALLGEWKLTSSENFEELMKELGGKLITLIKLHIRIIF
jgi:hypothetical protein